MRRDRFRGQIAGLGTTSGLRVVIGAWDSSPYGRFVDVMVQTADGQRILLAPSHRIAAYVADTYAFDDVRVGPVALHRSDVGWELDAPGLELRVVSGSRPPLGRLLRLVPPPVARSTWWASAIHPIARRVLPGVSTRGTAGQGRREWYGATDARLIAAMTGRWQGEDLGELAPVDPPVGFGFGSTPRTPMITTVVSTVEVHTARR